MDDLNYKNVFSETDEVKINHILKKKSSENHLSLFKNEKKYKNKSFKNDFFVENCPSNTIALLNVVAVNHKDFHEFENGDLIIIDGNYVFSIIIDDNIKQGNVGISGHMRSWGRWSLGQKIQVEDYDIFKSSDKHYLLAIELSVDFRSRNKQYHDVIDHKELVELFIKNYENQILQPTQTIIMDYKGVLLSLLVNEIHIFKSTSDNQISIDNSTELKKKGILLKQTEVVFHSSKNSPINLSNSDSTLNFISKNSSDFSRRKKIIRSDFKLEELGIGGLNSEFEEIFRRAFNSRIIPTEIAEKLDCKHCKGLLLHGPPGTGKTLIARKLSKMLNGKDPKIVNGPEILSKFVGVSEENVRKLFIDAENEYKEKGDESDLHIIVFDELDSLFKKRGYVKNDSTGVGDNIVNQLLSKMDGVDQLNNILIIGMTNQLDLIDTALLRPGRFEIQIEISLPNETGRYDIFKIHTEKLKKNDFLSPDIDFHKLSELTKNFTGAEIEGLCNSAKSFAISKHSKPDSMASVDVDSLKNMKLCFEDFLYALNDIKPMFGTDEDDLNLCAPYGIIDFNDEIKRIFSKGLSYIEEVKNSEIETLTSVLFHGLHSVGKKAIAGSLAIKSSFPLIKMLSSENIVGMNEQNKIHYIDNFFKDLYKSPLSVLVINKIESLINYNPIGPRFSNDILQLLSVYLKKKPPKGRRLLIIATTSQFSILKSMNLTECFTNMIYVKPLTTISEIELILKTSDWLSDSQISEILNQLPTDNINIGVKRLLKVILNCKYSNSNVENIILSIVENFYR